MPKEHEKILVCLDLGGVVVRHCRSWEEGCESAGLDLRDPSRMNTPDFIVQRRSLADALQRGAISPEEFWVGVARATDNLYQPEEIERLHHAWLLDEYEGVDEIVRALASIEHVTTACLSNTNVIHWETTTRYNGGALRDLHAVQQMTHQLVSHEMRVSKPDAQIYAMAEEATGFAPDSIVFFDDLQENVDAASARGWRAHRIDHESCTASQIREILEKIGIEIESTQLNNDA